MSSRKLQMLRRRLRNGDIDEEEVGDGNRWVEDVVLMGRSLEDGSI